VGKYFCKFEDEGNFSILHGEGIDHFIIGMSLIHVDSLLEGVPE
jgi:hypothetical protein